MGNEASQPAPTVIEDEPPAGSGQSSMVYPNRPETPRLDGVSRSLANECNECKLQVVSGISSSSVKVSREFGVVSQRQCMRYATDLKRVRDKMMSWQDFLTNLQAGRYLRNLENGYCEQVELPPPAEEEKLPTKVEEFDEGKLRSVRIQKLSSGGFSADTKAVFTPSIPFKIRFSSGGMPAVDITVNTMTLYHPSPLRLEGVQSDAVLSLNDPSFGDPKHVVLIPLVGRNVPSQSVDFLQKIMSQVVYVSEPEPSTGQYLGKDIATGANWTLSKLFSVEPSGDGNFDVMNGFYGWSGMPTLERKRIEENGTIRYSWVETGNPAPHYIMMDTPVVCSPADLSILTSRLPVTPASDAIHAVLYSSNPFQRGIVHKQGPPNCPTTKETFKVSDIKDAYALGNTELQAYMEGAPEEEACDAWTLWARASTGKGFTAQQIVAVIFNATVFIAMCLGAYLALNAVLRLYDVEYSEVSKTIGKLSAVFAKNLQQKVTALNQKLATLPMSPFAIPSGKLAAGQGDLSKLATGEGDLSKLAAGEGDLAKLAAASDVAKVEDAKVEDAKVEDAKVEEVREAAEVPPPTKGGRPAKGKAK